MHDYHKAKDMVEYAEAKAKELGKTRITKIFMKIGDSSGYSRTALSCTLRNCPPAPMARMPKSS